MKTIKLTGFLERQWHKLTGKKFRKQIRRQAIRMSRNESVEVVDEAGHALDYIPSDAEAARCGYAVERNV